MFRLLITSLILLITMNSCDKTLATYSMKVEDKDIIITDLIYIMRDEDGDIIDINKCTDNIEDLNKIECPNSITATGCDVNKDTFYNNQGDVINEFRSDSYVIGCFLLEEVLNHNPKVAKDIEERSYCFAIFKNFTGTITFTIKEEKYYSERLPILNIRGEGNINFHSDYDPESLLEGMDD